jgi:LacI family transcriptional regulator
MRPTIEDIAREAGVSTATVDRVLNARPGVHERTRMAVLTAAGRIGYLPVAPASSAASSALNFDIVLPAGPNRFMARLGAEFERQGAQRAGLALRLHRIEGFEPERIAAALQQLEGKSQGVALSAIDHPAVRDAIRRLNRSGTPVLTLATDIQSVPRIGYVGIDNRAAGRLAGYVMARFLGAGAHKVALLLGSVAYRGHEEREMGFRHLVAEQQGRMEVVSQAEVREDDARASAVVTELLAQHPDLAAIYNIGAGNRGIAEALDRADRGRDVVFIGHDLNEDTRRYLVSGTMDAVIDQNPRVEARDALDQLERAAKGLGWSAHPIRTQIIFAENIPDEDVDVG